jgi:hypothetical protein
LSDFGFHPQLKSTFHRVVSPTKTGHNPPRFSIAYFLHPNDDVQLGGIPSTLISSSEGAGVVHSEGKIMQGVPTSKEWRVHRHVQTQGVDGSGDGMGLGK